MHYSWSSIQTFKQCKYKWFLRYVKNLKVETELSETDPLLLGSALHKGIEAGSSDYGVKWYSSHFNITNDIIVNEEMKLRNRIDKVLSVIPDGKHELRISADWFLGFVDLYANNSIYDFKYANKVEDNGQLSVYKYVMEKLGYRVDKLYYVWVPKNNSRQKQGESVEAFRRRVQIELKDIEIKEVKYNEEDVKKFVGTKNEIVKCKEYPKNENQFCKWCEFFRFCTKGETMGLIPKAERRKPKTNQNIKLWIYGEPFSGKTVFADGSPMPLFLNTDGNTKHITGQTLLLNDSERLDGRMTRRVFGWQVFKQAISELEKDKQGYKTIVIDLVEDVYGLCRNNMLSKRGWEHESDDSFRAWDIVRKEFFDVMKRATNLDMNVILVSHEDTSKDITRASGNKVTAVKPNVADKIAKKLAGMVDVVARAVVVDDVHRLQFKQNEVVFGGGRINLSNKDIDLKWEIFEKLYKEV